MDVLFLLFVGTASFLLGIAAASMYWIDRHERRLSPPPLDDLVEFDPTAPEMSRDDFDQPGIVGLAAKGCQEIYVTNKRHERVRRHDSFHGLA